MDIHIGIDDTDHMAFFCRCNKAMRVERVKTDKVTVDFKRKKTDNCTWVYLRCECGNIGWRKFYWLDDGQFCVFRTQQNEQI